MYHVPCRDIHEIAEEDELGFMEALLGSLAKRSFLRGRLQAKGSIYYSLGWSADDCEEYARQRETSCCSYTLFHRQILASDFKDY